MDQVAATTDLFGQIAQYGLLGILFVLVVYALLKRDKDLTEERKARLQDALSMRQMIEADTAARVAATASQEERNRLMETMARTQELIVSKIDLAAAMLAERDRGKS
jgi:sirohydrochlorin ferrochelatase